eukprot:13059108-Alexandrium_andersonii.AAC.1
MLRAHQRRSPTSPLVRGVLGHPRPAVVPFPSVGPPDATKPRAWAGWCLHCGSGADAARSSGGAGPRSRAGM